MNDKLYDLMEMVKRTAGQAGDSAVVAACSMGKKTEALVHAAGLRSRLAELEYKIDACLREAGKMVYATHAGTPTESDALVGKLREIDGLAAQANELKRALGLRSGGARCATCGAEVRKGDRFCRECGGEL